MTHSNKGKFHRVEVTEGLHDKRVDKALSELIPDLSRSRIKSLIESEDIFLNEQLILSANKKVSSGDIVTFLLPDAEEAIPEPQNISIDIVYEDDDLLVVNKQAGLVVHPGAGVPDGTLVNALLYHCGDTLSGIGGVKRPGIVHRLDKDTTGLMIVAKNDMAHQHLSSQLSDRSLSRVYKAFVWGNPMPLKGIVDKPIGRHRVNRQKMTIGGSGTREAKTHYKSLETFVDAVTLLECRLESGRTHQIRVHMEHIRHPLIGDPVYGIQKTRGHSLMKKAGYGEEVQDHISSFSRQALHAAEISFVHPRTKEQKTLISDFPADLLDLYNTLKNI